MSKLLDIFINHWTEPWEVGRDALNMLAAQRRVDWENIGVAIIHDGQYGFPDEYFADYPFHVEQVYLPHKGISAARNWAIDHSNATWIKFCDFDDTFAGVFSLSCILDALPNCKKYDLMWFPLIVDMYEGNQLILYNSPVFIHDKIFRRSFLKRENIRFNETLYYSEDFAFSSVIKMVLNPLKIGKIETNFPIYVYVQRMGSINNTPELWVKNKTGLFMAHSYIESELRKRGLWKEADIMVARTMAECLFVVLSAGNSIDISDFINRVMAFYNEHKECIVNTTNEIWDYVVNMTNNQNLSDFTRDDVLAWIQQLDGGTVNEREDQ